MAEAGTARRTRVGPLDEPAMVALARRLAQVVEPPLVVFLHGDLGAGKTTLVRALVQALGHPGRVKSPTYGLLEHYALEKLDVLHLDLYRIGDPGELDYLGVGDLLGPRTVLLVEWPERGREALPAPDLEIELVPDRENPGNSRNLSLYAHSRSGNALCEFIDSLL